MFEKVLVSEYLNEWHTYDLDDTHPRTGAPWCLDCDDYATCGDWHPDA